MAFLIKGHPLAIIQHLRAIVMKQTIDGGLRRQLYRHSGHTTVKKTLFQVIPNKVDIESEGYKQNVIQSRKFEQKYNELVAVAEAGGGDKAVERHTQV